LSKNLNVPEKVPVKSITQGKRGKKLIGLKKLYDMEAYPL
jgi:hypothetical protein